MGERSFLCVVRAWIKSCELSLISGRRRSMRFICSECKVRRTLILLVRSDATPSWASRSIIVARMVASSAGEGRSLVLRAFERQVLSIGWLPLKQCYGNLSRRECCDSHKSILHRCRLSRRHFLETLKVSELSDARIVQYDSLTSHVARESLDIVCTLPLRNLYVIKRFGRRSAQYVVVGVTAKLVLSLDQTRLARRGARV